MMDEAVFRMFAEMTRPDPKKQPNPFRRGDRVRLSKKALKEFRCIQKRGVVATDPRHGDQVTVLWDGNKTPSYLHISFIAKS